MLRALIIDDEPGVLLAIKRWFERQEFDVQVASDGHEAVALLASFRDDEIDVILCDLHLPGISGDEILDRLSKHRPEVAARLILCTGDAIDHAAAESTLSKHPLVLQKPFDFASLQMIVDRVLEA